MLLIFFKRLNTNRIFNFMSGILFFLNYPVCFRPFIVSIIFAGNQVCLPFHKPIPKTGKYLNENNPNSLVLRL